MTSTLTIEDEHLAEVRAILERHLPSNTRVGVFGSRANGRVGTWSDLDLVVDAGTPLSLSVLGELAEAFDESLLPWKVDIVDRQTVSEAFRTIVDATSIPLL